MKVETETVITIRLASEQERKDFFTIIEEYGWHIRNQRESERQPDDIRRAALADSIMGEIR